MKPILSTLLIALITATLASCATSPIGRSQLILLPDSEMNQLGIATFAKMKQKQPVDRGSRNNRYVNCVAKAITAELTGKWARQRWEVAVFEEESPNAFALPGGKIGVHTGMFKVAENQHQLAVVIGHEVGHVMARHGNERISTDLAVQTGTQLAAMMIGGSTKQQQQLMGLLGLGTQVGVLLPFSRKHESEADLIGIELMARAGFNPKESIQLWKNMARSNKASPLVFLSTHPSGPTRIANLNRHMNRALGLYEQARINGKRPNCSR